MSHETIDDTEVAILFPVRSPTPLQFRKRQHTHCFCI